MNQKNFFSAMGSNQGHCSGNKERPHTITLPRSPHNNFYLPVIGIWKQGNPGICLLSAFTFITVQLEHKLKYTLKMSYYVDGNKINWGSTSKLNFPEM